MLLSEGYFTPGTRYNRKAIVWFYAILAVAYPTYVYLMYHLWYKGNGPLNDFHFFNDLTEWLMMDKVGHFTVCFHGPAVGTLVFYAAGMHMRQATMAGFIFGCLVLLPIEVFDGFSPAWGFSWADVAANLLGAFIGYFQLAGWNRLFILPSISFHTTLYALARPDMFGSTYMQQSLKDYNGQTYWFTVDINGITGRTLLPRWLWLSIGYSGEGMYGGHDNVWTDKNGAVHDFSNVERYTQWFLSLDVNFAPFIKNKILQRVLYPVNFFKVPFPAVEVSMQGVKFHWLYY